MDKLLAIQTELRAPKDLKNTFGGYHYRSCESILEALKPLLAKHGLTLTISDEMVAIGSRIYVRAIAQIFDGDKKSHSVTAYAREEETKKGMDASQITGAASSYARKYALNGLFLIDDTKDSDSTNTHDKGNDDLASKAAAARVTYNANLGPNASAMAQMAPKQEKSQPEAVQEPLDGSVALVVKGRVTTHYPPKGKGPHSFKVEGFDDYLKSFDEMLCETLMEHKVSGDVVEVAYEMVTKGNYTNAMITGISVQS